MWSVNGNFVKSSATAQQLINIAVKLHFLDRKNRLILTFNNHNADREVALPAGPVDKNG